MVDVETHDFAVPVEIDVQPVRNLAHLHARPGL